MKTMTSATANKMLKQLNNDLAYAYQQENQDNTYIRISGETPIIPDYNIHSKRAEITAIQDRIIRVKHALNAFNARCVVPNTGGLTIDQVLVKMSMLNREKTQMESMRAIPKQRPRQTLRCTSNTPEYDVANFDPKEAGEYYNEVSKKLTNMQLALDAVNSTETFEVDID